MKRMIVVGAALGLLGCKENIELCDIAKSDCQESIYYADVRVRGDGYNPFAGIPPIRTIDEAQFRRELEAEAEQAALTPSAEQPWWDSALALLRFMPLASESEQATIDNQVEMVAAYYDPLAKDVTVIDHKAGADAQLGNMITLAHELVHAIQDRELDLKIDPKTSDDLFAIKAAIEGDATVYEYLFAIEVEPSIKQRLPDPLAYATMEREMFMADGPALDDDVNFATLGPPYMAALYLVYPLGGVWVAEHYTRGGNAAVRHAYGEAPKRSLEYLLPFGTEVPSGTGRTCASIYPSEQGFIVRGKDILGAVQVFAYMMAWGVLSEDAVAAASLWRGDTMVVSYNPNTKKTAVAWQIELAQPIAPATLARITTDGGPRILLENNTLLITASDDAEIMANWSPSTSCR